MVSDWRLWWSLRNKLFSKNNCIKIFHHIRNFDLDKTLLISPCFFRIRICFSFLCQTSLPITSSASKTSWEDRPSCSRTLCSLLNYFHLQLTTVTQNRFIWVCKLCQSAFVFSVQCCQFPSEDDVFLEKTTDFVITVRNVVMFSQACVKNSFHGAGVYTPWPTPPGSRWYASYWNAFLFFVVFAKVLWQRQQVFWPSLSKICHLRQCILMIEAPVLSMCRHTNEGNPLTELTVSTENTKRKLTEFNFSFHLCFMGMYRMLNLSFIMERALCLMIKVPLLLHTNKAIHPYVFKLKRD